MKFDLEGTLYDIKPTQQITEKFKKREFTVECSNGNYTEFIRCELTGELTSRLDSSKIGAHVIAQCTIKGRYYNKKDGTQGHANNIVCYNVQAVNKELREPAEMYSKQELGVPF
jgi:single-strand DNA-binding protein